PKKERSTRSRDLVYASHYDRGKLAVSPMGSIIWSSERIKDFSINKNLPAIVNYYTNEDVAQFSRDIKCLIDTHLRKTNDSPIGLKPLPTTIKALRRYWLLALQRYLHPDKTHTCKAHNLPDADDTADDVDVSANFKKNLCAAVNELNTILQYILDETK
ncbi:hypothetical protein COB21_01330, partial [Candidatus Aerophobetes bacterium]